MLRQLEDGLSCLQRPSGAFAMLAIDQRETLRTMLSETTNGPVSDSELVEFKRQALTALSPLASAVLVDQDYGWRAALTRGAVSTNCGLVCAYDRFTASDRELVANVEIDDRVDPSTLRRQGAKALKLLVIWRPDEPAGRRIAMVEDFVRRCRAAGLISIIEPVSRPSIDGSIADLQDGIINAAREMGDRGQDLYKAEVPLFGRGDDRHVGAQCAQLTRHISSPWVILSSGVLPERFPEVLELACKEGASGFLAGRAIWKPSIYAHDITNSLKTDAVDRLKRLCEIADKAVSA
ncbi:tagatose-1,6-bisphosphate aldolase [Rhizobium leguminosarum bv. trifolii WSM597]|uniref:Tagatose-1,6-bisphosphate aldolase n=1 Tax=Rhizobium leguminosarum bv. trifolii WSM597 TaxID=754764 RepID=I9XG74_RHILT|nr:aldolase [Rhizobium leguminosarum]EJB08146.1 tagatose-1,6-bisphosphate aldolase [Rhizobium leguminosarum bv. trifolii WSM597]